MQRIGTRLFLLLTMLCALTAARPARADFMIDLNPVTIAGAKQLLFAILNEGLFKCSPRTLLDLLNFAEVSSGSTRQSALNMAVICCDQRTREINPATGAPYVSFPGVADPDRALFLHTALAQNVGDCLCDAIRCLRDGVACRVQVTVIGNSSTCSLTVLP